MGLVLAAYASAGYPDPNSLGTGEISSTAVVALTFIMFIPILLTAFVFTRRRRPSGGSGWDPPPPPDDFPPFVPDKPLGGKDLPVPQELIDEINSIRFPDRELVGAGR